MLLLLGTEGGTQRGAPIFCTVRDTDGRSVSAENHTTMRDLLARNSGHILWTFAFIVGVAALAAGVVAATSITQAEQQPLPNWDSPAAPVGVFLTPEDEATLTPLIGGLEWTARVFVGSDDVSVGVGLTKLSDPWSSSMRQSLDYSIPEGTLSTPVTVYTLLPPAEPEEASSALDPEITELLDLGAELTGWGQRTCATWTLADGTKAEVKPVFEVHDGWRTRVICEIPAIGHFTDLSIGASVTTDIELSTDPLVGRAGITVFQLSQPFISSTDADFIPTTVEPVDHFRLHAVAYNDLVFEPAATLSGVPGLASGQFAVGDRVPLVVADVSKRTTGQSVSQLLWVLVGLLGGWVGVAGYRAATWRPPS